MICIKKRTFQNRIDVTTKSMELDKADNIPNSKTDEIEGDDNQEEIDNPDLVQDQLSTVDAQEVINIFSEIISCH
jgi:hypothetical protein